MREWRCRTLGLDHDGRFAARGRGAMTAPKKAAARDVLLATGQHIAAVPPGGADMAFSHALLCQVGLPRKKSRREGGLATMR